MPALYPDAYDHCTMYFLDIKEPETRRRAISLAWNAPNYVPGGLLFSYVTPNRACTLCPRPDENGNYWACGCLTQVKRGDRAWSPELTRSIRADPKIPNSYSELCVLPLEELQATLEHFADWQRRVDLELGRSAPILNETMFP